MKKKLSLVMALVMIAAMFAVFAIPTSAKTESAVPVGDAYAALLGEYDIGSRLYGREGEYWDWSVQYENGVALPSGQHWLQFVADIPAGSNAPTVRISQVYIPEDAVFADGEEMSINWIQVHKNFIMCLCQNYDFNTGIVRPTTMSFRGSIVYQEAVPEAERRGVIQFIDTVEFDGTKTIQKTYANGKLVLQTEVEGSLTWNGVQYNFLVMNGNVPAGDAETYKDWFTIPSYVTDKGVRTFLCLYYHNAPVSDSIVAGLYNIFANRYNKDVVWYPQDEVKNGLVVGKGGIRYYVDGEYQTGWVDGRYFYKETGYLATEDITIGGAPYAYNEMTLGMDAIDGAYGKFYFIGGEKVKGWLDENHYYYLETGEKCTSTRKIGGIYYEYSPKTDLLTKVQGFIDEAEDTFYLIDGVKATGWQEIDGAMCYFYKETGVMVIDATITILGVPHTFDADGICIDYVAE